MKASSVSKFVGASVIAASLAILPLTVSVQAQTDNNAADTNTQTTGQADTANTYDDNNFDWGWLGLLGLAGLAGLLPKKRQETVYRSNNDPNVGVGTRSDYR